MTDQSMGKLATSSFQAARAFERDVTVQIVRLDTFVFERNLTPPQLIKIDVEGAEVKVLEGASRILNEYRPKILLETHSNALAGLCVQKLDSFGYRLRELQARVSDEGTHHFVAERI